MSYEGRVVSSEAIFTVVPMKGNTHIGQRDSGYSVVSSKVCASRHRTGENASVSRSEDIGKLCNFGCM